MIFADSGIDHLSPRRKRSLRLLGWRLLWAALALWASWGIAAAQFVGAPWPLQNFREVVSGSIAGAAVTVAFTLGQGAKTWCLFNPSNQTEPIFWRLTGTATTTYGANFETAPGMYSCWGGADIVTVGGTFNLSINATTNPHPYAAFEGQ